VATDAKAAKPGTRLGHTWALGTIALLLFALQAVTGVGLAFHYRPAVESAYFDAVDLGEVAAFGFGRELHRWGSHALVIAAFLHLLRVFMTGSYRPPRRLNWILGIGLLFLTLLSAATGYLLPWDQNGYWAGAMIADGLAPPPSEATLTRFYALHAVVLPVIMVLLIAAHLWRARRDDRLAAATDDAREESPELE
jgi:cytochrome b6